MITTSPFRKQDSEGSLFPLDSEHWCGSGTQPHSWYMESGLETVSFKAESYRLFKGQMAHTPLQAAPTHSSLVVTGGRCWGSQWWGLGNGNTELGCQVHCPVLIYPTRPVYPRTGRCECPRVSTGCNLGHLGSSSRSPPDPRITWVMSTLLDFRLLSVK